MTRTLNVILQIGDFNKTLPTQLADEVVEVLKLSKFNVDILAKSPIDPTELAIIITTEGLRK